MNLIKKMVLGGLIASTGVVGAAGTAFAYDTDDFGVSNAAGGRAWSNTSIVSDGVMWIGPQAVRLKGTVASDNDGMPATVQVRFCYTDRTCGPVQNVAWTNGQGGFDRPFYATGGRIFRSADVRVWEQGYASPFDINERGGA